MTVSHKSKPQNFHNFIDNQIKFEEKRFDKIQNILMEAEKQEAQMFKPQVSKGSE